MNRNIQIDFKHSPLNKDHEIDFKTPFALDEFGKIITPSEAKKGVDYTCLSCNKKILRLRGGEYVSNHFYHLNGMECGKETIIHKAYKAIFSELKQIRVPCFNSDSELITFDEVILEKRIDDIQPDCIGIKDGKRYFIEFAFTHLIDDKKRAKIRKGNFYCLEVVITENIVDVEAIKKHLLDELTGKEVINDPSNNVREHYKEEAKKYINNKKKILNEQSKKNEELEKKLNIKIRSVEEEYKILFDEIAGIIKHGKQVLFFQKKISSTNSNLYTSENSSLIAFVNDSGELVIKVNKYKP